MDIRHAVGVKAGVPAEKLANLLSYRDNSHFSGREQAALEFCERTARDDLEVTGECLARVRRHFSDAELVELTFVAGFQIFASKFAKAFRIAPQGFSAEV
jgi:alkylhydroperoxidase family enzyme